MGTTGYSEWIFCGYKRSALEGDHRFGALSRGMHYEDVENIRPESKKMVETWLKVYGDAKDVVLGVESAGNQ
jgi:hypothetical protein